MKLIKIAALSLVLCVVGVMSAPAATFALNPLDSVCTGGNSTSEVCANKDDSAPSLISTIVNTMLFIVGALSVVMIIVGGILYTTSTGDSGRITRAKNTITYAIVGLIVAFLAYAIVNWVIKIL